MDNGNKWFDEELGAHQWNLEAERQHTVWATRRQVRSTVMIMREFADQRPVRIKMLQMLTNDDRIESTNQLTAGQASYILDQFIDEDNWSATGEIELSDYGRKFLAALASAAQARLGQLSLGI